MSLTYKIMTVTPSMALDWLSEKNKRNRKISQEKVKIYSDDMKNGRWKATHQNAIAFYKDGNLADGQHRLLAIFNSDVSITMFVYFDLDDDAAFGIDAHRMRKTDDQIAIAGLGTWINKDVVACARMLMEGDGNRQQSPQSIAEFAVSNRQAFEFVISNLSKKAGPAPVRAATIAAYYHEDKERLTEFCRVLGSGICETAESRSIIALRERILRDSVILSRGGSGREALVRMTMRSIQAFCRGEIISKIYDQKARIYDVPSRDANGGKKIATEGMAK